MNQYIDAAWKYWKQRDQDGWIRGYGSPLCPANTSKILLHVKQFSLKTNWRLAKRVFYNQDCKKHPQTQSWVGKEKKKSGQDLCPKEMTERRRNTRVRRFYQGSEQFDSQARHPSFWSNTKTSSLLSWFENQHSIWPTAAITNLGADAAPSRAVTATEYRRQPSLCLALDSSPAISSPTSHHGGIHQILGGDVTNADVWLSYSTKVTGYTWTA